MFLILFRNILCPQFAQPKQHHEQQCVRNNVSSFASTFRQACLEPLGSPLHNFFEGEGRAEMYTG